MVTPNNSTNSKNSSARFPQITSPHQQGAVLGLLDGELETVPVSTHQNGVLPPRSPFHRVAVNMTRSSDGHDDLLVEI
jgi:hypothetical protein